MTPQTITDTKILDIIIDQLTNGETDDVGKAYANYEDEDTGIYIEASVRWIIKTYSNYIDGYLEGEYDEVTGWQDLEVDAYIGDEKAEIDEEYIYNNLTI